jgi:spore coat protein A
LRVEPRKYHLRIINGSNARFYRLRLSDGRPFVQIGTDQGLLQAPVQIARLLLAPAERADVIVDFRGARVARIRLMDDAPSPYPKGPAPDLRTTANVMEFRVDKPLLQPHTRPIPGTLRTIPPLPEEGATVRHMAFREFEDARG